MKTSVAIYPGSFDPVTNGHLDLIERGERMFDHLIVAVLKNVEKEPLFSLPERVDMLREVTQHWDSVEIDVFEGLLVDYARKRGAGVILRGIRHFRLRIRIADGLDEPQVGAAPGNRLYASRRKLQLLELQTGPGDCPVGWAACRPGPTGG